LIFAASTNEPSSARARSEGVRRATRRTGGQGRVRRITGSPDHRITGSTWLEHQWGNFKFSTHPWGADYIWSALQFNDGSVFTFRQWYDQKAQPLLDLGRHSRSTPDGITAYGFGASVKWEGLKTWKSPATGRNYPTQSRLTTPFGTWYYTAVFDAYEIAGDRPLWEGPCWIRSDSVTGPVIGKAFLELPPSLTKVYPVQA
jgi:predicted secreted hydrolase